MLNLGPLGCPGGQRKGTSFDELWPQDKQGRHQLRLLGSRAHTGHGSCEPGMFQGQTTRTVQEKFPETALTL